MFEALQDKLTGAFRTLTGQGRLSESNMRDALAIVEQALLEADVGYQVVKNFIAAVQAEALGEQVLNSLKPMEVVYAIVYRKLVELMGPGDESIPMRDFTKIMLCGLQGSGKTTTCAKLARLLKQNSRRPLMVAADLQRPAAIHQLQVLGEQIEIPVFADTAAKDPVELCQRAVKHAQMSGADTVLFDTAGRLHIDDELMQQLRRIDEKIEPHQCYLVVDGMTGQDAVNSAKAFNEALELNGVILTKLDGDQQGGAVLSVRAVTGVPIKFMGTGEHIQDLEPFSADRMAGRILGQGDIVELARRTQEVISQDELRQQQEAMAKGQFTLDTFRDLLTKMKRMGSLGKMLSFIPGMSALKGMMGDVDVDQDFGRVNGMIDSMTLDERRNPRIIDQSRRRRIATGSGVEPHEVNALIKQFDEMADAMKRIMGLGPREQMKEIQNLQKQMAASPGGLQRQKVGTGKRLTSEEKARIRKQKEKEMRRQKRKEKGQNGQQE